MSKEKKSPSPKQLPEIKWHEPTARYGYFEVIVPVSWDDFKGIKKVKTLAVATLNIVEAIKEEYEKRAEKEKTAEAEVRDKAKVEADSQTADNKKKAIQKIIDDEPDAVLAKRKEVGEEVINDQSAASILYAERQGPVKKPSQPPKSAGAKTKTTGYKTEDLPYDADFGNSVRFFKSEYGWNTYLDQEVENLMIPALFDWLITIPKEVRHRRGDKYPCISYNGRYIMVNDYEKDFITAAVEAKGMDTEEILED